MKQIQPDTNKAQLDKLLTACWEHMDGIYGGNAYEPLPIETFTPDRKEAADKLLAVMAEISHGE